MKRIVCLILFCFTLIQLPAAVMGGSQSCSHLDCRMEEKAASCTASGYAREICNICGAVVTEEIFPAKGHNLGEWTVTVPPGCETPGEEVANCSNCGIVTKSISATGHSYGPWMTVANETNVEIQQSVCQNCGKVRERTVAKEESYAPEPEQQPSSVPDIDADAEPFPDPEGWTQRGGDTYYYLPGRKYATGWLNLGVWYYFNDEGIMQTGWQKIDGETYYLNDEGIMQTGWLQDDRGKWFWLSASGAMKIGWHQAENGIWYYFAPSGEMQTGWLYQDNNWYYLYESGAMCTGWVKSDRGYWYYMDASGRMQTGWLYDNGSWYYLNGNGVMCTGWIQSERGYWYYLETSGRMKTGWLQTDTGWYCLSLVDGHMLTSCYAPDGHWINEQGLWVP